MLAYDLGRRVPGVREALEARLVRKVRRLLVRYGDADFTSDARGYRPTMGAPAPAGA